MVHHEQNKESEMKTKLLSVVFGAILAIGAFAPFGVSNVSALTLPVSSANNATDGIDNALPVEKAQHQRRKRVFRGGGGRKRVFRGGGGRKRVFRGGGGRRFVYRGNRHGPRFRTRRGRNRHYYNGFWYTVPFWLGTGYYAGQYYGDSHIQWCLRRYRSYNPRTDTYRGYDGYDHRCISPYS